MLKFAIVCLCIFQLIPSLAPAVQPDVHSELYVLIDLAEHLGGTPATEVSTPSVENAIHGAYRILHGDEPSIRMGLFLYLCIPPRTESIRTVMKVRLE